MTRHEIFDAWAPQEALWSKWVKPVVFAHILEPASSLPLDHEAPMADLPAASLDSRIAPADGRTAIVVDLPGAESVRFALLLASSGYRPVPLFNSVPGSRYGVATSVSHVVVDMSPVVDELGAGAEFLNSLSIPANAPPAFCLDARRRVGGAVPPLPGVFDNRSISLPADFPSANLLRSEGVSGAMIVFTGNAGPERDLCHTLRRWQEAGIELSSIRLDSEEAPQPLIVRRPPLYGQLWYGFMAALGLRPNLLGGYGGFLPDPSAG